MPVFATPDPISVQIDLPIGDAWITASDRADTVVEVRPRNPSSKADAAAVEQTVVDFVNGHLTIRAPKSWWRYSLLGSGGSIDITIALPSGSSLGVDAGWATLQCEGRLGACRFHSGGAIRVDQTAALTAETSHSGFTANRVDGDAHITTASGAVRIRDLDGVLDIKSSSGECWVGTVTGDVRARTASGDLTVDRALAGVAARTAYGAIRVGEVARGSVDLETAYGSIEVGVRAGTAAWLDLTSRNGTVRNTLDVTAGPDETDETVEVRASTAYGNILIRRS